MVFDARITIPIDDEFYITCNGNTYTFKIKNRSVKAYMNNTELELKYLGFEIKDDQDDPSSKYLLVNAGFDDPITFRIGIPIDSVNRVMQQLQKFIMPYEETTDGEAKAPEPTNSGGDVAGSTVRLRL